MELIFMISLILVGISSLASANDLQPRNDETAEVCKESNDLVIVLDSSGSIGAENYNLVKDFVVKLSDAFSNSRQGFIYYSGTASILFSLMDDQTNKNSMIREHPYKTGASNTHLGIKAGMDMILKDKESNPGKKNQEMLVITDGESTYKSLTRRAANLAISNEIRMYALGIGDGFEDELLTIAGGRTGSVFTTHNFTELEKMLNKVSSQMCSKDAKDESDYCLDIDSVNCAELARAGHCETNSTYMHKSCPDACGLCDILCLDNSKNCPQLVTDGQCEANATLMNTLCPSSCGLCANLCLDTRHLCPELSHHGHCETLDNKLHDECPVSCGLCETDGFCLDHKKNCSILAKQGECEKDSAYMKQFCPLSCDKCGKDGHCQDRLKNCWKLAENGECRKNSARMADMCPLSCGRCRDHDLKLIEELRQEIAKLKNNSKCESECEKEPKTNFATYFENPSYDGDSIKRTLDICCTLPNEWKNRISSLHTSTNCVKAFSGDDCSGESISITSHLYNLHQIRWGDKIRSTIGCNV